MNLPISRSTIEALGQYFKPRRESDIPHYIRYTLGDGVAARPLTTGVEATIDYNSPYSDYYGLVTTGAAWRFFAKSPGIYMVNAKILLEASTAWELNEECTLWVYRTGARYTALDRAANMGSNGLALFKQAAGVCHVDLGVGDWIAVNVMQNTGGTVNIYNPGSGDGSNHNYIEICKIPG